VLILLNQIAGMGSPQMTMLAAIAIVLAGIPHGTLDVEIASIRFGLSGGAKKFAIIAAYGACALLMAILWRQIPELALTVFLVISIIHFSADFRRSIDPFLSMMVGWALIALPALSHPQAVAAIFELLTDNQNGATIAALLACSSVPAVLGSLVFAFWCWQNGEPKNAVDISSCLVAALFLPPLIAFAVFFCGLHSPRHMMDALRETSGLSPIKKSLIVGAVTALSVGLGVAYFFGNQASNFSSAAIRSAFILLSTLTVPHFILEHFLGSTNQKRAEFTA
jgi:Brp/Blh family beta-carotene 15,15'-monooxygenase